jgi:hypothetical protein
MYCISKYPVLQPRAVCGGEISLCQVRHGYYHQAVYELLWSGIGTCGGSLVCDGVWMCGCVCCSLSGVYCRRSSRLVHFFIVKGPIWIILVNRFQRVVAEEQSKNMWATVPIVLGHEGQSLVPRLLLWWKCCQTVLQCNAFQVISSYSLRKDSERLLPSQISNCSVSFPIPKHVFLFG